MEYKRVYRNSDGVRRTSVYDEEEPFKIGVFTEVDMTQAIDNNKIVREQHPRRGTNKLLARAVPMTVVEQSIHEQWDDNDWKKWLNDPDNAAFRIWPGRV